MPLKPVPPPLIDKFLSCTIFVLGAPLPESLTLTPVVPDARIEAKVPPPSMVIDFVIVTAPKPPGSIQSISPPSAVFEIAPAKVLQGAVRLHGLTSSPTPETQVRVACAWAMDANASMTVAITKSLIVNRNLFIWSLLFLSFEVGWPPVEHGSVPATVAPHSPYCLTRRIMPYKATSVIGVFRTSVGLGAPSYFPIMPLMNWDP